MIAWRLVWNGKTVALGDMFKIMREYYRYGLTDPTGYGEVRKGKLLIAWGNGSLPREALR